MLTLSYGFKKMQDGDLSNVWRLKTSRSAIQEQQAMIEDLKAEIEKLKVK
jgi:hypothetical protein